jgi:hypothetical protein
MRWASMAAGLAIVLLVLITVVDPWTSVPRRVESSPKPISGEPSVSQSSNSPTPAQAPSTQSPRQPEQKPTFTEIPGAFVVLVGHQSHEISPDNTKKRPANIAPFGDAHTIQAYIESGRLYVDALLYYAAGQPPLQLVHNSLKDLPPQWDRNYDDSAIEIVDENLTPRFQIIYKNPRTVMLRGVFQFPRGDGVVVIEADRNRHFVGSLEDSVRIDRLFNYPSRLHQGEELSQPVPRQNQP